MTRSFIAAAIAAVYAGVAIAQVASKQPAYAPTATNANQPQILWIRNDRTGQVVKPGEKVPAARAAAAEPVIIYNNFDQPNGVAGLNLNWNYQDAYTNPSFSPPNGGDPLQFQAINISSDPTDPDEFFGTVGGEKLCLLFEPYTATGWPVANLNDRQNATTYSSVTWSRSDRFEIRICRVYFFSLANVNLPFDVVNNPYALELQLSFAFASLPFQTLQTVFSFDLSGFDPPLTMKGKGLILTHWLALTTPPPCPGDLNGDGVVDDVDFSYFVVQYDELDCQSETMPYFCSADLNADGLVDDTDFVIFLAAYNTLLCPEPSLIRTVYAPLAGGRFQWDSPGNTPTYTPAPKPGSAMPVSGLSANVATRADAGCTLTLPAFQDRSTWETNLWPTGTVPYEFDANVDGAMMNAMGAAMDELEAVCDVHFIPRTNQPNYIHIQADSGNFSSYVGMRGGRQVIGIFNWNFKFIMCHELMHALGLWHEQMRPDRDTYISVNLANIQPSYQDQFELIPDAIRFGPYDFESIMHYGPCGFSTCCNPGSNCLCDPSCYTMTALPPYTSQQSVMGNRDHLSQGDIAGLVSRYGPPGQTPAESVPISGWPMPNSLLTVPDPSDPGLCIFYGCEPSYNFYLTSHSGLHQLPGAELRETVPLAEVKQEYERFVNAAWSTPGAVARKAVAVPSTLGPGKTITADTHWVPSSTPKRFSVTPVEAPPGN